MASSKIARLQAVTFLVIVLILSAPNFIPILSEGGIYISSEMAAYGVAFWLLWFAIFKYIGIGLWLALPVCLWWGVTIYVRLVYATPITSEFLGMALDTNTVELFNFLSTFGYGLPLVTVLGGTVSAGAAFLLWRKRWAWAHRSRWWVILGVSVTGILLMVMYLLDTSDEKDANADPFHQLLDSSWLEKWGRFYPLDLPIASYRVARDKYRIDELRTKIKDHDFKAHADGYLPDVVVFVLGESSRRDRWGIFGYERQTTPHLANLENIVTLNDVISISTATRSAVPSLISRRPFYGPDGAANQAEPSILKAFSAVGYRTHWISNQTASGFYDTPIAFYAKDADEVVYKNPANYTVRGSLDGELLSNFEEVIKKGSGRKFIVLHTMGSHFNYAFRYPKEFAVYQPSMDYESYIEKKSVKEANVANNTYDNTIVYTDFVLWRLISILQDSKVSAILAYVSDHGEDVWEPGCNDAENQRKSSNSFEIPALVWFSNAAAGPMQKRMEQLRLNAERPVIGKALPQTLLDLAGIEVAGVATDSFLRTAQLGQVRRVYAHGGWVDFDVAKLKNACYIAP